MQPLDATQIKELIAGLDEGVALLDAERRVLEANPAFRELTGLAPGDRLDAPPFTDLPESGERRELAWMVAGRKRHCEVHVHALGGDLHALVCRDVSALRALESECKRLAAELSDQSLKDAETGVLTERGLTLVLESQVSRSRRYGNPLTLVVLGLYGRDLTPQTYPAVARILRDQLRWADVVARGEAGEFFLLLPETGGEDAARLVEKLQARLAAEFCDRDVWTLFGLAEWTRVDDERRLIRRARQHLQQAHARLSA